MTNGEHSNLTEFNPTAKSYVQDSAVFFLDGIENSGFGKPHNPNATSWVDLSPNPSNQSVNLTTGYYKWKDTAFVANDSAQDERWKRGANLPVKVTDTLNSRRFTIEYTGRRLPRLGANADLLMFSANNPDSSTPFYSYISIGNGYWISGQPVTVKRHIQINSIDIGTTRLTADNIWNPYESHSVTVTCDKGHITAYFDGIMFAEKDLDVTQYTFYGWYTGNNQDIHRITIHGRPLLKAEVEQNYRIDKMRFGI